MADDQTPISNPQIDFEKFKYKVELFKWFIGSVVLVLVSLIINYGFKDRAAGLQEIQQYDKYATDLIVLNDNVKNKRMLAQFFSKVTVSTKLKKGWECYYAAVDSEYKNLLIKDSLNRDEYEKLLVDTLNQSLQRTLRMDRLKELLKIQDDILTEKVTVPDVMPASVIPTVYIQYSHPVDSAKTDSLAYKIKAMGFKAPGIELVENSGIANDEIRYYFINDRDAANTLQQFLKPQRPKTEIKYIPALSGRAKQGTIELWLK